MIMSDDPKSRPKLPGTINPHKDAKFPPDQDPKQGQGSSSKRPGMEAATLSATSAETEPGSETTPASISEEQYAALDDKEKWKVLVKAICLNRSQLLRIPGVTAVDLGYKIVKGSFTDELALRVHVERKLPDESLATVFKERPYDFIPKDRLAGQTNFQLKNYDVPTDVIEANYKPVQLAEPPRPRTVFETPKEEAQVNRRKRLDPLVGGISIGSPHVPVGTLGALVWDNTDGRVCILSNWHVLSGDLEAEAGTPCFQPGRFDQGRSSDIVARLKRWSFDSQTDAALAELTGSRHHCAGEIVSMFQQISGVADPYLGMVVLKSGRSTGFTWGFVDGLYFSSAIGYSDGVVQVFENQIHIAPANPNVRISEGGDSGSVWVTEIDGEGYKAVGLHFAGDLPHAAFGEYALANPMTVVQDRLGFSFRPRFLEIPDEAVVSEPAAQIEPHDNGNGMSTGNGNGIHPIHIVITGLNGSSGQPDPIQVGPTGG